MILNINHETIITLTNRKRFSTFSNFKNEIRKKLLQFLNRYIASVSAFVFVTHTIMIVLAF